jgi:hypothetical protein
LSRPFFRAIRRAEAAKKCFHLFTLFSTAEDTNLAQTNNLSSSLFKSQGQDFCDKTNKQRKIAKDEKHKQ